MKDKFYYQDGTIEDHRHWTKHLHREDGPAVVIHDGTQYWYQNSLLHRLDGPAMILSNGKIYYAIHNRFLTEEEFERHPLRQKYLFEQELEKILTANLST